MSDFRRVRNFLDLFQFEFFWQRNMHFELRNLYLEMMRARGFLMYGLFEPGRLISHEHFSMFYLRSVRSKIAASLHPYFGSVLAIIEPGMKTLRWGSTLRRPYSESNTYYYSFHSEASLIRRLFWAHKLWAFLKA